VEILGGSVVHSVFLVRHRASGLKRLLKKASFLKGYRFSRAVPLRKGLPAISRRRYFYPLHILRHSQDKAAHNGQNLAAKAL
jgi:hypothetical protein